MSMEQFIEIAGRSAEELGVAPDEIVEGFLKMRKDHITGVFAYPAEEGVLPQDRAGMAELMEKIFETVAKAPFLASVFDPIEIFKETVRQRGMHNISDFLRKGVRANTQILDMAAFNDAMSKGRLQPINGAGRPDEGIRRAQEGLTLKGAIEGAGRTRDQRTV
jgi:hypothetical protein